MYVTSFFNSLQVGWIVQESIPPCIVQFAVIEPIISSFFRNTTEIIRERKSKNSNFPPYNLIHLKPGLHWPSCIVQLHIFNIVVHRICRRFSHVHDACCWRANRHPDCKHLATTFARSPANGCTELHELIFIQNTSNGFHISVVSS